MARDLASAGQVSGRSVVRRFQDFLGPPPPRVTDARRVLVEEPGIEPVPGSGACQLSYDPAKFACLAATLEFRNIFRQPKSAMAWPGVVVILSPAGDSNFVETAPRPGVGRDRPVTCDVRNWQYITSAEVSAGMRAYRSMSLRSAFERSTVAVWELYGETRRWIECAERIGPRGPTALVRPESRFPWHSRWWLVWSSA